MADKSSLQRGGRSLDVKVRAVTRSMTTATAVATLPKGARIIGFILSGTASDAGTTATLSVGNTTTATEYVNAVNVLAAGVGNGTSMLVGVTGALGSVLSSPTVIYVKYAETGAASAAGAWKLTIMYTVGNFVNDDA
jgi:hypothetical protein